ncbi:MAG: MlaD family protein [Prevotellaceae bacterium]|jgi:phospholipid/cholesterol/gamma-HCH transport system substrate-binding protein|nr:MlaD family protein [Prevotellaceae bacterium]
MPSLKKNFTKEAKIGIVGVIALFILIYGLNYLRGARLFHPTVYFFVKYAHINGLSKSSPVYADGFKVGIVSDIIYNYERANDVVVEVELDTEMRIPKGSTAELETDMLGSVHMNLLLSNNMREKYAIGDTIPGISSAGVMGQVADMMPQVQRMIPKLDSILSALNVLLHDENIPATLQSIRHTTANLETTTGHLNGLLRTDIPQITGKLIQLEDNFLAISENLKEVDYAETIRQVQNTLTNVQLLTDKLNRKDNSLGLLLNDDGLYRNLNTTVTNASTLLEDLKAHPKRYVHFSIFGRKE